MKYSKMLEEMLRQKYYGDLEVLGLHHIDKNGIKYLLCRCKCGNTKVASASNVRMGFTTSCGCKLHQPQFEDLTNQKFNHLTVIKPAPKSNSGKPRWYCRCDCGNPNLTIVLSDQLKSGRTKSCGCEQRRIGYLRGISNRIYNDDDEIRIVSAYRNMMRRCYDVRCKNYDDYGGRGITVCEEWRRDRFVFIRWAKANGYQPGLEIDRIRVNENYCPGNCRWITHAEQNRNRRNNRHVVVDGIDKLICDWRELVHVFDNWCAKMYRRPRKEGDHSYAFSNEEAAEALKEIFRVNVANQLCMDGEPVKRVIEDFLEHPRATRFYTIRGKVLTAAQWFNRLGITRDLLTYICKQDDSEVQQFLISEYHNRLD